MIQCIISKIIKCYNPSIMIYHTEKEKMCILTLLEIHCCHHNTYIHTYIHSLFGNAGYSICKTKYCFVRLELLQYNNRQQAINC